MKRLIFIPILLTLILGVCMWSAWSIGRASETVGGTLSELLDAAEQNDRAKVGELADRLENEWLDASSVLTFFLYHGDLDEITTKASEIKALAANGSLEECMVECRECARMIQNLKDGESFHAGIFL